MRRAIVGSREFSDIAAVRAYVLGLPAGTVVITGGARGVDKVAELAALARGLSVEVYHANWQVHGRQAGVLRNMIVVQKSEALTAFWDGQSPGTAHAIRFARQHGLPVDIVYPTGHAHNPE